MNWVSAVGYAAFPLPASGRPQGFQGTMHLVITAAVVLLSIASLVLIFYGGCRKKACLFLGRWAMAALVCMLLGALGTANMWWAVFADVGVCVIAVLNAMRMLRQREA